MTLRGHLSTVRKLGFHPSNTSSILVDPANMPMFDFACSHCDRMEPDKLVSSFSASLCVPCSVCGRTMERLPAAPAFALKGSGFYANDSKVVTPRPQPHQTKEGVHMQPVSAERAFRNP